MSMQPNPELIDEDNPEWTDEMVKQSVRFDALPESLRTKIGGRGPQKAPVKQAISVRFSPEVLEYFRSTGAGWQTRMDGALKEWIKEHRA